MNRIVIPNNAEQWLKDELISQRLLPGIGTEEYDH
jgi:hypothetical protein